MTSGPAAVVVASPREADEPSSRVLRCGDVALALRSDDGAAADWLAEFLNPWFAPSLGPADVELRVSLSGERRGRLAARGRERAAPRACFALDQQVFSLPAWAEPDGVAVDDAARACLFVAAPSRVDVFPDPATRRWRFTLQWICHEVAATRLRRTAVDLHAAVVETGGRALAIVGPKGAGKTTLSFHLLRSGGFAWMANDRTFVGCEATGWNVRGMPTPVKILAPTLRTFPELRRGLRPVERPYLHAVAEALAPGTGDEWGEPGELALSPPQVAHQLGVARRATAPLGAVVFPELRVDQAGFAVRRLAPGEAAARLAANLYGRPSGRRVATLFEELDGGWVRSCDDRIAELADAVPAHHLVLGPAAHRDPDFAARLLAGLAW